MNNCISFGVRVASFSFQIAGAIMLLTWAVGNSNAKIQNMCLEDTHMLGGEFDGNGIYYTLEKTNLRKNATIVYQNIIALFDIIVGYALAIFMSETSISNWCVLIAVIILTLVLILLERFLISQYSKWKYHANIKVQIQK